MRFGRRGPPYFSLAVLLVALLMFGACGGSSDGEPNAAPGPDSGRSSGASEDSETTTDSANDSDEDANPEADAGSDSESNSGSDSSVLAPELSDYVPTVRDDGLELVFAEGALGPAVLGTTIEEVTIALGASYEVTPEESIRVDFPAGYSISRDGEVLFFAIEEDGVITVFMTQHRRVGLDSGLRPGIELAEAIELHGEPTLTLGPEAREFASFEDGTGTDGSLSVLVAIGQFGGPVGIYDGEPGEPATGYGLEEANIKELWFWAD